MSERRDRFPYRWAPWQVGIYGLIGFFVGVGCAKGSGFQHWLATQFPPSTLALFLPIVAVLIASNILVVRRLTVGKWWRLCRTEGSGRTSVGTGRCLPYVRYSTR